MTALTPIFDIQSRMLTVRGNLSLLNRNVVVLCELDVEHEVVRTKKDLK